jgi:hypothetical protein
MPTSQRPTVGSGNWLDLFAIAILRAFCIPKPSPCSSHTEPTLFGVRRKYITGLLRDFHNLDKVVFVQLTQDSDNLFVRCFATIMMHMRANLRDRLPIVCHCVHHVPG